MLSDYFRCSDSLLAHAPRNVSRDEGYFTFFGTVCYGRCAGSTPSTFVDGPLPEVSGGVEWKDGEVHLPFDLDEVVGNLRYERYRQPSHHFLERMTKSRPLRSLYYGARPHLPVAFRRHLQKLRLRGWNRISFPNWPVDVSADRVVGHAMRLLLEQHPDRRIPFIWFWPEGAAACAVMTHDVEGSAGRDFCTRLMDIDESFGIRAAFQIVPDDNAPGAQGLLEKLRARGFEVNVHDLSHDGSLFNDREAFRHKAGRINRHARDFGSRGFRSGAMYREQEWFEAFEFSYDMSVPNAAHLEPQRGGCCTVMPYFVGDILELPLTTTQDYSLFHILGDYSTALWKRQIELILANHGFISFIAHPDYLIEPRARDVYVELLAYLADLRAKRNVWITLPGDVDRWWRCRSEMRLVEHGSGSRIEGPDSARARIAHATLEDGQMVYRLASAV
jgi:hypothetical protein